MTLPKQVVIRYTGYVQGVGFRYTTARLAERFQVTGYVKNLPDGSVECVVEGEEAEILRFAARLRASPLSPYMTGERMTWSEATGHFKRFSIAY